MATMSVVHPPPRGACEDWPVLGLGTWRMGERAAQRVREVAALRSALEMGYRLIDTAEMYGEGGAEEVVGQAMAQAMAAGVVAREHLRVVSKCYPQHAAPQAMARACDASRKRLGVECIDLYLLHWRGSVPLADTVQAFQALQQRGWIRHWGVSNFTVGDMQELWAVPGGAACATNQVYYSLGERGIEFDLLPWMHRQSMPVMAYCPVDGGTLSRHPGLAGLAAELGATASQVALTWLATRQGTMAIPKAARVDHLRENLGSIGLKLPETVRARLETMFPAPGSARPLAMV